LPVNRITETREHGNGAFEQARRELADTVTDDTSAHPRQTQQQTAYRWTRISDVNL